MAAIPASTDAWAGTPNQPRTAPAWGMWNQSAPMSSLRVAYPGSTKSLLSPLKK